MGRGWLWFAYWAYLYFSLVYPKNGLRLVTGQCLLCFVCPVVVLLSPEWKIMVSYLL